MPWYLTMWNPRGGTSAHNGNNSSLGKKRSVCLPSEKRLHLVQHRAVARLAEQRKRQRRPQPVARQLL